MKNKNRTTLRKIHFTLMELLLAMLIFSILLTFLMNFFLGAEKIWTKTESKNEMYNNAKVAMDLIARSIQGAFYDGSMGGGARFFKSTSSTLYITTSGIGKPNQHCESSICEVKYQMGFGGLGVSVTGDKTSGGGNNSNWNFQESGSDPSQRLIPYVTNFTVNAYRRDGTVYKTNDKSLPYSVTISFAIVDRLNSVNPGNYTRTLTKTIVLGERGQYAE